MSDASRKTNTGNGDTISLLADCVEASVATQSENDLEIPDFRVSGNDLAMIRLASAKMGLSLSEFVKLAPYLYARDYLHSIHIDPFSLKETP
jgi:hypothetical protein